MRVRVYTYIYYIYTYVCTILRSRVVYVATGCVYSAIGTRSRRCESPPRALLAASVPLPRACQQASIGLLWTCERFALRLLYTTILSLSLSLCGRGREIERAFPRQGRLARSIVIVFTLRCARPMCLNSAVSVSIVVYIHCARACSISSQECSLLYIFVPSPLVLGREKVHCHDSRVISPLDSQTHI